MVDLSPIVFKPWPKIARFNRDIVITEKIDGTNAAIGIVQTGWNGSSEGESLPRYAAYAQSRTRLIAPDKKNDNMGFAAWVRQHAAILIDLLGPGLHFGEWWGVGIQRGYGLSERRFSLFNTSIWAKPEKEIKLAIARSRGVNIYSVPVMYEGPWFDRLDPEMSFAVDHPLYCLQNFGSVAAKGFTEPEGIVIYHKASGQSFKVTLENDEQHKGETTNA